MVAWASTSNWPGWLSSGSTSVRSRATPSRLDCSTSALPSDTAHRWAPSSTKWPSPSQRNNSATPARSPGNRLGSASIRAASTPRAAASAAESPATWRASATTIGSNRTASASARWSTDSASCT